jgi:hypothetical protein
MGDTVDIERAQTPRRMCTKAYISQKKQKTEPKPRRRAQAWKTGYCVSCTAREFRACPEIRALQTGGTRICY